MDLQSLFKEKLKSREKQSLRQLRWVSHGCELLGLFPSC